MSSKDEMRQSFDEVAKLYGIINQPKRLVKDGEFQKEFTANGNRYVVCAPEMAFNFDKQLAYKNLDIALGLCQTVSEIAQRFVDSWETMTRLMGAKGKDHDKLMADLHRQGMNNVDSLKKNMEYYYPQALYICTMFILKEGEDLAAPWTYETQKEKIKDWAQENYSFYDFFCLAVILSK
jgi:hypothetical protein